MTLNKSDEILVIVDGIEKARINLSKTNSTRFSLDEKSKEIEIYRNGTNGREFLEVFPVDFNFLQKERYKQNFKLAGGEDITFDFVPVQDKEGKISLVNCGVTYVQKETPAPVAAVGATATSALAAADSTDTRDNNKSFLIPAAVLLLLLTIGGIGWFAYRNFKSGKEVAVSKNQNAEIKPPIISKDEEIQSKVEPEIADSVKNDDSSANVKSDDKEDSSNNSDETPPIKSPVSDFPRAENVSGDSDKTVGAKNNRNPNNSVTRKNRNNTVERKNTVKRTAPAKKERVIFEQPTLPIRILPSPIENAKQKPSRTDETNPSENSIPSEQIIADNNDNREDEQIVGNNEENDKSLLEIRKIYLDWQGDITEGLKINQNVINTIQSAELFKIVDDKKDADAALRIKIRRDKSGDSPENPYVQADMWLINTVGTILTPKDKEKTLWKYKGALKKMPDTIVSDIQGLATAARKEKQRKAENLAETKIEKPQIKPVSPNENQVNVPNRVDKDLLGKNLLEVKKINLEWEGDIDTGVKINDNVIENIENEGGIEVIKDKENADATLKINIKKESEGATADNPNVSADMWLINDQGTTLTPTKDGKTAWKYKGELKKMPKQIVDDIGNLKKAEKEKEQTQINQDN